MCRVGYELGFVIRFDTINEKQLYNAIYSYMRSVRGPRIELQQLMMLLDCDDYMHWSRCHESSHVVSDVFWTHLDVEKLLNAFSFMFLMDTTYKNQQIYIVFA